MQKPRIIPAFTTVRFFAAAAVVAGHMFGKWGLPNPQELNLGLGIGVDMFLVLTGFILTYTYREYDDPWHDVKLMCYRIARIWALHIFALLLWVVIARNSHNPAHNLQNLWASVLLIQTWFGNYFYGFQGNAPSWTLSVELFFYIVFPFLIPLRSRIVILIGVVITGLTIFSSSLLGSAGVIENVVSGEAILRTHPGSFFSVRGRLFCCETFYLKRLGGTFHYDRYRGSNSGRSGFLFC